MLFIEICANTLLTLINLVVSLNIFKISIKGWLLNLDVGRSDHYS